MSGAALALGMSVRWRHSFNLMPASPRTSRGGANTQRSARCFAPAASNRRMISVYSCFPARDLQWRTAAVVAGVDVAPRTMALRTDSADGTKPCEQRRIGHALLHPGGVMSPNASQGQRCCGASVQATDAAVNPLGARRRQRRPRQLPVPRPQPARASERTSAVAACERTDALAPPLFAAHPATWQVARPWPPPRCCVWPSRPAQPYLPPPGGATAATTGDAGATMAFAPRAPALLKMQRPR